MTKRQLHRYWDDSVHDADEVDDFSRVLYIVEEGVDHITMINALDRELKPAVQF